MIATIEDLIGQEIIYPTNDAPYIKRGMFLGTSKAGKHTVFLFRFEGQTEEHFAYGRFVLFEQGLWDYLSTLGEDAWVVMANIFSGVAIQDRVLKPTKPEEEIQDIPQGIVNSVFMAILLIMCFPILALLFLL